ncbi:MAG TPA: sporulation protein YabP [Clostridiaceae bacterium]|nr:sporulation protein YabP [Clostridiaceae bacterium]
MVLHTKKSEGGLKVADEKKIVKAKAQNLILENREKLSITGVIDVESFNDECVVIDTELGILIIRGEDLRINKLNIDNSELNIEGDIYLLEYSDKDGSRSKGGFFGKMFR